MPMTLCLKKKEKEKRRFKICSSKEHSRKSVCCIFNTQHIGKKGHSLAGNRVQKNTAGVTVPEYLRYLVLDRYLGTNLLLRFLST